MSNQVFINYWIGQEPIPPSPPLDQMPAYVNIVPLAFFSIDENYDLQFDWQEYVPQIPGWIQTIKANGTKVLASILDKQLGAIPADKLSLFVSNVAALVKEWDLDGIDFDFEPPSNPHSSLISTIQALRNGLPEGMIFTAPVYSAWSAYPDLLQQLSTVVDYITTMDYTPYPGYEATIDCCDGYAGIIKGGWPQLVIGMSCMVPANGDCTPLDDVVKLSQYEPSNGESKGGCMLYTFSYDVTSRKGAGTGYPDGTWTKTIYENMP